LTTEPTPGHHRAAEQRQPVEGEIGLDLDQRAARHHGMVGKHRQAELMVDRLPVELQPASAREKRPRRVGLSPRLAQRRPAGHARQAVAAARHEGHDDPVAGLQIVDAAADLRHDAAASCPSAMGTGRGRSPLITDKSEWQRPAALIPTRTSPSPGGSSSSSSTISGRLSA
jgi:hypothetical protein